MKIILKSMVALSLVSSVAFGAKIYVKDVDEKSRNEYKEVDTKIGDDKDLLEFAKDCNLKLEYGKDENNVERIIVIMANGEKAILEYFNSGSGSEGDYFTLESELWVKKVGKRGSIKGISCPTTLMREDAEMRKENPEKYSDDFVPDFEEYDYLEYLQSKRELKTDDDNATDETSEIRNWFIDNAVGLQKKVNETK